MEIIEKIEQSKSTFKIKFKNSSLNLKCFLDKNDVCIDISHLNLTKAIQVAILSSTYCFLNGFQNNLRWLVKDLAIKDAISILCLKNTQCEILGKVLLEETA